MPAANSLYYYVKSRLFGINDARNNAFDPLRLPTVDMFGGGNTVRRQLHPYASLDIQEQMVVPVSILGNGSDLTGSISILPLIDVSGQGG